MDSIKKTVLLAILTLISSISLAQTQIVAHRGAWKNSNTPQNSIASLQEAIKAKYWGSEFDVCLTSDNILIVNHDNDYQGMDVSANTYETLIQKKLKNGEKLPTAEEFMREGLKQKHTTMVYEIKPSKLGVQRSIEAAQLSYDLVKKLKGLKNTVFISFSYEACLHLRKLDKKVRIQYLGSNKSPLDLHNDNFSEMDFNYNVFKNNPNYMQQAKDLKMKTNVWTVNTEQEMNYFIDQKADYITTDEPELLNKILKK